MASIYKRANGIYSCRFVNPQGIRKAISLSTRSERQAERDKVKIESLLSDAIHARAHDDATEAWLAKLRQTKHGRKLLQVLSEQGLLAAVENRQGKAKALELGDHLEMYFSRRNDVKQSTLVTWGHTKRNLLDFFGNDKPLGEINDADAEDFERYLKTTARVNRYADAESDDGLSAATVRKRISICKQLFRDAVKRRLIPENPFSELRSTVRGNRSRDFFVTREMAAAILDACPDAQWRLIFALSRFGGLRCPSEHLALTVNDVDWERERIRVWSPKTEHHEGKESRLIPLFPELRPYLEAICNAAENGETHLITRYRSTKQNLRTHFIRIIKRAGFEPWPKLFQNLRATRQTELENRFPSHVVNTWIGNSRKVSEESYLQVTDSHFAAAANSGGRNVASKATQGAENEQCGEAETAINVAFSQPPALGMGDTGFEPVTSAV